jgi:hypothetical protein
MLAFASTQSAACYSYRPIEGGPTVRAGEGLRLYLTSTGSNELARYFGPQVTAIDGDLVNISSDSSVTLGVTTLHFANGTNLPYSGDGPVAVAHGYVSSIERRTLARTRTAIATTAFVGGLIALAKAALHTGHVSPGGGPPPPPPP